MLNIWSQDFYCYLFFLIFVLSFLLLPSTRLPNLQSRCAWPIDKHFHVRGHRKYVANVQTTPKCVSFNRTAQNCVSQENRCVSWGHKTCIMSKNGNSTAKNVYHHESKNVYHLEEIVYHWMKKTGASADAALLHGECGRHHGDGEGPFQFVFLHRPVPGVGGETAPRSAACPALDELHRREDAIHEGSQPTSF